MKSFGRMEMTGTAAGNSKLRLAGSALGAAAIVLLSTTLVSAEELRVIDAAGKTRSVADIAAGSSAAVNVTVAEKLTAPLSISLLNSKDNKVLHTTSADAKGFATFKNIESGTYKVTTTDSKASLATVEIVPTTSADQGAVEGDERNVSRSMYVAGASAVAGVLGVSLANSGGSGDSTGAATVEGVASVKGTGGSGVAALNPDGSADEVFQSSGAITAFDVAPNPGEASPAPTTVVMINPPESEFGGNNVTGITLEPTPAAPAPSPAPPLSGS